MLISPYINRYRIPPRIPEPRIIRMDCTLNFFIKKKPAAKINKGSILIDPEKIASLIKVYAAKATRPATA